MIRAIDRRLVHASPIWIPREFRFPLSGLHLAAVRLRTAIDFFHPRSTCGVADNSRRPSVHVVGVSMEPNHTFEHTARAGLDEPIQRPFPFNSEIMISISESRCTTKLWVILAPAICFVVLYLSDRSKIDHLETRSKVHVHPCDHSQPSRCKGF